MNRIKSYYQLCKPNVVYMMLVTALVGILLASDTVPSIFLIFGSLLGIGLCAGSAAAVNQIIDRNVDASMKRTDKRPLPQGEISAANAAFFTFVIDLSLACWVCVYLYYLFKEGHASKYCYWGFSRSCTTSTRLVIRY